METDKQWFSRNSDGDCKEVLGRSAVKRPALSVLTMFKQDLSSRASKTHSAHAVVVSEMADEQEYQAIII